MILVVEDNDLIVDWMRSVIQASGYYFDAASDAYVALYKAQRLTYALILIDIILPGMSGGELARWIKALPEPFGTAPLVGMTGGTFRDDSSGPVFAELLHKPFLPADLRALILRLARPALPDLHIVRGEVEAP